MTNVQHPISMHGFLTGARVSFEQKHAEGVNLNVYFDFNGKDQGQATILIKDCTIDVKEGFVEVPDLIITTDVDSWLQIVNKEVNEIQINEIFKSGNVQVKGNLSDLKKFQNCFVGQLRA